MLAHDLEELMEEPSALERSTFRDWTPDNDLRDGEELDMIAVESLFEMINNGRTFTSESMRDAMVCVR